MINNISERSIIRSEAKAKAIDLFGGKCIICGSEEKLEFDHIKNDRNDNYHCISAFIDSKWGSVLIELKKCQLLCFSCHRAKTIAERNFKPSGTHGRSLYVTRKCRCDICKNDRKLAQQEYRRKKLIAVA